MGNTLQEILQGRGDKKRQGTRIKVWFPSLLLFLTYLGLLLEFPIQRRFLWFICCLATILIYSYFHIIKKEKSWSTAFLLSLALLIAGSAQALATPWLRMAYFPFLLSLTAFYEQKTVFSLLLLIPFLELANFLRGGSFAGEAAFILSLISTIGLSLLLKRRTAGILRNDQSPFGKESTEDLDFDPELETAGDGKVVSHYLDLMSRTGDEIQELLGVAKKAVLADSVNLFMSSGGTLNLRSSTDGSGGIIPSSSGLLHRCFEEKTTLVSSDMSEGKYEAGYLKKGKISSLVLVPVTDGNFPLGVMTADSSRVHAFSSADGDTLQMFSQHVTRILQRERVFPHVQRSYSNLKILSEESTKLLSSLDENVIVRNLIEGARRIAPSEIIFFTIKGRQAGVLQMSGSSSREDKVFDIKGTILDMAAKNREPIYISDAKSYRSPIMPFSIGDINSVFLLPMFYERNLLGILSLLLEKINALSSHQIELLEVLGNQASTSMANARFHAAIEKLAITDGLTGLFNHKQFQEKLMQEFNRIERFSDPLSLLLIDIDYFKKINDSYGHPVGDSALRKVADVIKKTIRNIDIPARYGGEEFAVLLPGTNEKGAVNMAERLRKTVMETKFVSDKNAFNVTISIGISTNTDDVKKREDLVDRADKALYLAKGNGRNRCIHWSEIGTRTS